MKKLVPFIVIGVLLLAVGLVAAQTGNLPGAGWLSGQQVQNVGSASAKIAFTAYDQNGNPTSCDERNVPAGSSTTWQTSTDCNVAPGFLGSAVVSADQPIAAIVNVNNVGTGLANGQYQGTDGADVAQTIVFPLVKHNHVGRTTTFYVQNASTSSADITAQFVMRDGTTKSKTFPGIAGNAMVVITPGDVLGGSGGTGQVGSMTVTANQPMAGSALEHETSVPVANNLMASKGFTPNDFATKAYCPLYRNAFARQKATTGLQVQNLSNTAQEITMTFTPRDGGAPIVKKKTADPNGPVTFYAPNEGSIGSVEVTSAGNIAAVINEDGDNKTKFTTYACFPDSSATAKVNIPLAKEHFLGNTTGIQIQNVGAAPATNIQLVYTDSQGAGTVTIKNAAPVAPGASFTANEVSNSPSTIVVVSGSLASIDGKNTGVVITADQPIVAIANEVSTPDQNKNQDNKNYEGFNQ